MQSDPQAFVSLFVGEAYVKEEVIHSFNFRNVKLWELPSSILKQPGLEGMLPLLPLTREGRQHDMVEEMITAIKATGRNELLQISFNIAGLVFKTDADKEWLKGRFKNMYDILEESWVYQEILEKGMQKGIEQGIEKGMQKGIEKGVTQGIRQMLGHLIEKRFPSLSPLAQQSIQQINNQENLQAIYDKLIDVNTVEEARQVLLSIEPNTR